MPESTPDAADWRGIPFTDRCTVLYARRWGKNLHSTELVEGTFEGLSPTGRVRIRVTATSRDLLYPNNTRDLYAVPAHSVAVLPTPAAVLDTITDDYDEARHHLHAALAHLQARHRAGHHDGPTCSGCHLAETIDEFLRRRPPVRRPRSDTALLTPSP
ncbi:hypothetical protein ACWD0J_20765 [Streptomyces sp. NPDC003011]